MKVPIRFRGLATRLAATLTLALFPIGLIAVVQSAQISREIDRRKEASLLALTADAAAGEALVITEARGAAQALLAQLANDEIGRPECSAAFSTFVNSNPRYSFAGYVDAAGNLTCGSGGVGRDVRNTVTYLTMIRTKSPHVVVSPKAQISGTPVIVVALPRWSGPEFVGYVALSIPQARLGRREPQPGNERPLDLITFNGDGEVLSSEAGVEDVTARLPKNVELASFVGLGQTAFTGMTNTGEVRTFAITPILPGEVYAMGSWPDDALDIGTLPAWVFPVIMLITGLLVAWFATNRFVIRHIRRLQRNMEEFARSRRLEPLPPASSQPRELLSMNETWQEIAQHLLMDEAELEGALKEKNVLLKEVHHRVKNNLQLIASIVAMKLRRARSPDATNVLKEVQMRVMSIAAVHRSLYTSSDEGRVRADELLHSVIDSTIEAGALAQNGPEVLREYDPVVLFPDQAVPLSLFASEAVTNALKYVGRLVDGRAMIKVTLRTENSEHAVLTVVNSVGTPMIPPETVKGSGLGASLLGAFAMQMRGEFSREHTETEYIVQVRFPVLPFDEAPADGHLDHADLDGSGHPSETSIRQGTYLGAR